MAEINIERKSGPPAWLWIVGALVLGVIAWAVISMARGDDEEPWTTAQDTAYTADPATTPTTTPALDGANNEALQAFNRECVLEEGTRTDDMGREHTFAINCLEQLAGAIESVAGQLTGSPNIDQHVETIRQNARQIRESEATSTEHAGWTREAALAGASALEALQRSAASPQQQAQNAVSQARESAQQLQAGSLQLEQLTALRSYFRNASQALESLARQRA